MMNVGGLAGSVTAREDKEIPRLVKRQNILGPGAGFAGKAGRCLSLEGENLFRKTGLVTPDREEIVTTLKNGLQYQSDRNSLSPGTRARENRREKR